MLCVQNEAIPVETPYYTLRIALAYQSGWSALNACAMRPRIP